jgi:hypothetical protein
MYGYGQIYSPEIYTSFFTFSRVNSPGNTSYIHIPGNQSIEDYLEHYFYDPPEVAKPLVWCH